MMLYEELLVAARELVKSSGDYLMINVLRSYIEVMLQILKILVDVMVEQSLLVCSLKICTNKPCI